MTVFNNNLLDSEMDQCHDVLIIYYGPIQFGISTQIVRVAPQCC